MTSNDVTITREELLEQFLDARGRARGPIVCVSSDTMLTNAGASYLVGGDDHEQLWEWASRALAGHDQSMHVLQLGDREFDARCEPISLGSGSDAALLRLSAKRRPSRTVGRSEWDRLRDSERGIAELVAAGLTNREVGDRLLVSRHTVDAHLRHIYRKLGIRSRVELTRVVVEYAIELE
jgi:DNA-binding CsgD family transcriptional regulator